MIITSCITTQITCMAGRCLSHYPPAIFSGYRVKKLTHWQLRRSQSTTMWAMFWRLILNIQKIATSKTDRETYRFVLNCVKLREISCPIHRKSYDHAAQVKVQS